MRLFLFLAVALLAGCNSGPRLSEYNLVHDFRITDQTGGTFSADERLKGRVWVANWIFTTCMGPCPRMTSQMKKLAKETEGVERRLVSFTIDPERDTPPVLAEYAQRFEAEPQSWHFLTGTMRDLHNLSRNVFMVGNTDGTLEHSTRFVLVDQRMRIRGYYDSSDAEALKQLAADVRALARS